jgi:hypothetical protein
MRADDIYIPGDIARKHGVDCPGDYLTVDADSLMARSLTDGDRFGIKQGEPIQLSRNLLDMLFQEKTLRDEERARREAEAAARLAAARARVCPHCGQPGCGGACMEGSDEPEYPFSCSICGAGYVSARPAIAGAYICPKCNPGTATCGLCGRTTRMDYYVVEGLPLCSRCARKL